VIKLGAVLVFTNRFQEQLAFYRERIGLTQLDVDSGTGYGLGVDWVALTNEDAAWVELFDSGVHANQLYPPRPTAVVPAFVTDDLEAAVASATAAGAELLRPITSADWGRYVYLRDPDGNQIQIYQEA
jgi:predicted enzyme related to lactoylglutathione lyase